MKRAKPKPGTRTHVVVWVAVSAGGHVAYFLGCAHTRTMLQRLYRQRFGHTLQGAGYRPLKLDGESTVVSR